MILLWPSLPGLHVRVTELLVAFIILGLLGLWGNADISGVLWKVVVVLTVNVADQDVLPDSELAIHVYKPESLIWRSSMNKVPLLAIVIRFPSWMRTPSLCQCTFGVGVPTARQGNVATLLTGSVWFAGPNSIIGGGMSSADITFVNRKRTREDELTTTCTDVIKSLSTLFMMPLELLHRLDYFQFRCRRLTWRKTVAVLAPAWLMALQT